MRKLLTAGSMFAATVLLAGCGSTPQNDTLTSLLNSQLNGTPSILSPQISVYTPKSRIHGQSLTLSGTVVFNTQYCDQLPNQMKRTLKVIGKSINPLLDPNNTTPDTKPSVSRSSVTITGQCGNTTISSSKAVFGDDSHKVTLKDILSISDS